MYMNTYMQMCMYICMYIHECTYRYGHVCEYVYLSLHIHIYIYIYRRVRAGYTNDPNSDSYAS